MSEPQLILVVKFLIKFHVSAGISRLGTESRRSDGRAASGQKGSRSDKRQSGLEPDLSATPNSSSLSTGNIAIVSVSIHSGHLPYLKTLCEHVLL